MYRYCFRLVLGGAKIGKYGLAEGFTFTSFKIAIQLLPLYNLSINLYVFVIKIAALWNAKAKKWLNGRHNWRATLSQKITTGDRIIWMHCSSAGEFEQGKPVIEKLKELYPDHKFLVTFFSPSGFEAARSYRYADIVTYLPIDTADNAKEFVAIVTPELAIFIKYDFWYHHFSALAFKQIPLLLVSAVFRRDQMFFKPWGKFYKQMLFLFRHIFVQDVPSMKLLKLYGVAHCSICGDTRFDRVIEIARAGTEIGGIEKFVGDMPLIVAGSTWAGDEKMLQELNG
ncbi:MAG: glycosyltransferase N-terminal domain-containing protein, partial [Bacteroidota bacterium]